MAQFRIDQVGPGSGTPGVARHDLVPGAVITLVATAPTGPGVTYTWELLDVVGSTAVLSANTGASVTIGPAGNVTSLSGYRIKMTAFDGVSYSSTTRICSVRGAFSFLRPPVFSEGAIPTGTLASNDPNLSEDNALYPNRAGRGAAEQNWRDWAEWAWEMTGWAEDLMSGGGSVNPAIMSASGAWAVPFASVVGSMLYATGSYTAALASNVSVDKTSVLGVIVAKPTTTTATVAYAGEVSGFVGLTPGGIYYLGTNGAITLTPPNTPGSGNVVQRVGIALSTTKLLFRPLQEVVL